MAEIWVSILSQPEGRELQFPFDNGAEIIMFQSSPSPKAGSYGFSRDVGLGCRRFQSSPSPKAGSYVAMFVSYPVFAPVSILSQPEGRELPMTATLSA